MAHSSIRANAIAALALALFGAGTGQAGGAPSAPSDFVVVQREPTAAGLRMTDGPPSLDDLGFEVVPVPEGVDPAAYASELESLPGVVSAHPDARVRAAAVPNDTYYGQDQLGYYAAINAPGAWDLATGRESVVVAILDSGADLTHPDLAPRLWTNPAELAGNGLDDDGNGCVDDVHGCRIMRVTAENQAFCGYTAAEGERTGAVTDDNGRPGSAFHSHGTMVAGIVGAAGNNGTGVAGVAWNVRLMIVKVLDCGTPNGGTPGGRIFDVAAGIDYARRMGADVINLSLASDPGDVTADSAELRAALNAAEAAGVIVVAAAGNYGRTSDPRPGYPAAYTQYPNLVAVGSADWTANNTWAPYSAYGPSIDFAAPGNRITSTVRTDLGLSVPYGRADQGTSFSAPLTAGMFALMMSRNSRLGYQTYISLAKEAAIPAPQAPHGQPWAGAGIINLRGAVERVPMLITGSAQHDWVDVPADATVEARVGAQRCGKTQTVKFGPVSRFELLTDPDAVTSGCGSPGTTVEIYVNGARAQASYPWGGTNEELVYTGQAVTTVTPAPGPLVVQQLSSGWNNVAHLDSGGALPGAVAYLPTSWDAMYAWSAFEARFLRAFKSAPAYVQDVTSLQRYDPYWVHTNAAANVASINPQPAAGRTVELAAGWNNVVYTGTSREASDALKSVDGMYSIVYRFDNPTGTWQSYIPGRTRSLNSLGGLLTMQVYWVYMTAPGTLVMN